MRNGEGALEPAVNAVYWKCLRLVYLKSNVNACRYKRRKIKIYSHRYTRLLTNASCTSHFISGIFNVVNRATIACYETD